MIQNNNTTPQRPKTLQLYKNNLYMLIIHKHIGKANCLFLHSYIFEFKFLNDVSIFFSCFEHILFVFVIVPFNNDFFTVFYNFFKFKKNIEYYFRRCSVKIFEFKIKLCFIVWRLDIIANPIKNFLIKRCNIFR